MYYNGSMKKRSQEGKVCVHCGLRQPLSAYNAHSTTLDRLQSWCKVCKNKSLRERRHNNLTAFREKEARLARQYRQTPNGIYQQLKFNARRRGVAFDFTRDEFVGWFLSQPKSCYYCKQLFDGQRGNNFGALTIDRKDARASYNKDNVVFSCRKCNTIKGYWFTERQMLDIAKRHLIGGK